MAKTTTDYNAESLEVLKGLDPVRTRPGMYTDTTRPNHIAQEVIDNAVDEALAGHCSRIDVTLHSDNSLSVQDNGRGMPVDIHPEEGLPGVELILTKLHAGAKFSRKEYQFSGGLHGVGVSVTNALSTRLEVTVKRAGLVHQMAFESGYRAQELAEIGTVGKKNTGTLVQFWPDPKYFDTPRFLISKITFLLRAKAVLCPGLMITFTEETSGETTEWYYEDGLPDYVKSALTDRVILPTAPFVGTFSATTEAVEWALAWTPEGGEPVQESYANLIPTIGHGTHVNGLRTGLTEAVREFCEFRNLIPRGVKLTPDDVWTNLNFVLSAKLEDPQFASQTKERLTSRECAAFVSGVVKDSFGLWLNQHSEAGGAIAQMVIDNAQARLRAGKKVARKKLVSGPALPGKLADCSSQDNSQTELFLVEGDSAGGSAKQAREREFQAIMPLRGKILNTWEVDPNDLLASNEVHDITVAIGVDPGSTDLSGLRYGKICILADADSDGAHIATLICALFLKHFPSLVAAGHVYVAMPPLFRIDVGKEVFYALDEHEKQGILDRVEAEKRKGKIAVTRFKGLGEMNPIQLRETTMAPDTRRLIQLTLDDAEGTTKIMDMLLGKKRAADRKSWLQDKGDLAEV